MHWLSQELGRSLKFPESGKFLKRRIFTKALLEDE
jgi:hypothetical protein